MSRQEAFHSLQGIAQVHTHFRLRRGGCLCRRLCNHCFLSIACTLRKRLSFSYSRAQRYGSNASMFGRAHFDKSNGEVVVPILRLELELVNVELRVADDEGTLLFRGARQRCRQESQQYALTLIGKGSKCSLMKTHSSESGCLGVYFLLPLHFRRLDLSWLTNDSIR
jgi:hypothetical protein